MNKLIIGLIGVLASLNVACVDCEGEWSLEGDWKPSEIAALNEAVSEWNDLIGYEKVKINETAQCKISKRVDNEDPEKGGWYYPLTGNIEVWSERAISLAERKGKDSLKFLKIAFMHELGHGLGFGHIDHKGAVMHETVSPSSELDMADYRECVSAGVCEKE